MSLFLITIGILRDKMTMVKSFESIHDYRTLAI